MLELGVLVDDFADSDFLDLRGDQGDVVAVLPAELSMREGAVVDLLSGGRQVDVERGLGEATAHLLSQLARAANVRATRLAHGVPLGGELEFIDRGTLAHAFGGRQLIEN